VPTLILSGSEDLRTPTSSAREVAALIPGSHLLVVPDTGHSVLGGDPSSCSGTALQALFAKRPIVPCRLPPPPALLRPALPPPTRLSVLAPAHGASGLAGRTARAVELSIADLIRQLLLGAEATAGGESLFAVDGIRSGGLRSGWARLQGGTLSLHDYSFVPGVALSGTIKPELADLRVGGSAAAGGTLHLGAGHALVGRLGGHPVQLPASSQSPTAIVASDAAAGADLDPRDSASIRAAVLRARRTRRGEPGVRPLRG
jgi:hypothetical protein